MPIQQVLYIYAVIDIRLQTGHKGEDVKLKNVTLLRTRDEFVLYVRPLSNNANIQGGIKVQVNH